MRLALTHGTQKPFKSNIFRNFAVANQIAEGVNEAHQGVKDAKCNLVRGAQQYISEKSVIANVTNVNQYPVSVVDFNVTLAHDDKQDSGGGLSVLFGTFNIGAKAAKTTQQATSNSVSFQVYLSL